VHGKEIVTFLSADEKESPLADIQNDKPLSESFIAL
jgi:hypothetical protein